MEYRTFRPYEKSYAVINHDDISFITPVTTRGGHTYPCYVPTKITYMSNFAIKVIPGIIGAEWIKNRKQYHPDDWDYSVNLYDFLKDKIAIVNMVQGGVALSSIFPDIPSMNIQNWHCWMFDKSDLHRNIASEQIHSFALHSTEKIIYTHQIY